MGNDRFLRFHAPYGKHTEIRIPSFGRAMAYEQASCHLMVPSCNGLVYRVDLEEGRFAVPLTPHAGFKPVEKQSSMAGSCIAVSPTHQLTCVGCEDGIARFWDNRSGISPFVNLDVASALTRHGAHALNDQFSNSREITSVAYDYNGMNMAVGTRGGCVALYDMRSDKPLYIKEHQYGMPIHTVQFHKGNNLVLSSDARLIKIWHAKSSSSSISTEESSSLSTGIGSIVTNVEGKGDINSFIIAGDEQDPSGNNSGLILCATEQSKLQAFYCPILGKAPRWCSFLDGITEELEEDSTSTKEQQGEDTKRVYDDFKFVTREEVDQLGCAKLIGTPMLRGYMHGYFIDIGLYNRLRAVANPFEYEEYRKKKIREKLEEKRASRIAPKKKRKEHTVNAKLINRLQTKVEKEGTKASKEAKVLLEDNRFGNLFDNPDFEINEESEAFKLRNASGVSKAKSAEDMDSDREDSDQDEVSDYNEEDAGFIKVRGFESDNDSTEESDESDSDEDGFKGSRVRGEGYENIKIAEAQLRRDFAKKERRKRAQKNVMYEADEFDEPSKNALAIGLGDSKVRDEAKERKERERLPLEKRLAKQKESERALVYRKGESGGKEVSYIPKSERDKIKQKEIDRGIVRGGNKRERRGVKNLNLSKSPNLSGKRRK